MPSLQYYNLYQVQWVCVLNSVRQKSNDSLYLLIILSRFYVIVSYNMKISLGINTGQLNGILKYQKIFIKIKTVKSKTKTKLVKLIYDTYNNL